MAVAGFEHQEVEWTAATDWDGLTDVEGFEAMVVDKERDGWTICGVAQTQTGTRYTFRRPTAVD